METSINIDYNRNLQRSPMAIINKYDPLKITTTFIYLYRANKVNVIKIGNRYSERIFNANKLDLKFEKKGYWCK